MRNTGRRDILKTLGLITVGSMMPVLSSSTFAIQPMKRKIYKGNEEICCIGLGTWQTFDVGENSSARDPLREVLRTLVTNGASVVDSSPMYGSSEKVVGDLTTLENLN